MTNSKLTFIVGCTGCGKGALGQELARRTGGEIVSLDSMKIYRRMDIGTAKPSADIRKKVPHHVIDVVEPSEEFSVARYVELAGAAIADIQRRSQPVFVVGGTPLYLKALTEGLFEGPGADEAIRKRLSAEAEAEGSGHLHQRLIGVDPQAADRIHPNDLRRIIRALEVFELTGTPITELQAQWDRGHSRYDYILIGLRRDLEDQNRRTNARVKRMIKAGLADEVRSLLVEPHPLSNAARQALGYAEMIRHLKDELTLAEAIELIKINTRQFAKSQRTWFKRFRETQWVDLTEDAVVSVVADELFARHESIWKA